LRVGGRELVGLCAGPPVPFPNTGALVGSGTGDREMNREEMTTE
jgi:hypothetical protein